MTKQRLKLIRQAERNHADGGTKWRKRMERWMETAPVQFKWFIKLPPGHFYSTDLRDALK